MNPPLMPILALAALLSATGCGSSQTPVAETPNGPVASPSGTTAADKAVPALTARLGDVRVSVAHVEIGRVPVLLGLRFEQSMSSKEYLQIDVDIENLSESKEVEYVHGGWGDPLLAAQSPAQLRDDKWNAIYRVNISTDDNVGWVTVADQQTQGAQIAPRETIRDRLVFMSPKPEAQELTLTLPAQAVGQEGEAQIIIPMSRVERGLKSEFDDDPEMATSADEPSDGVEDPEPSESDGSAIAGGAVSTSKLWPGITVLVDQSQPKNSTELGPPAALVPVAEELLPNLDDESKQQIVQMKGETPHAEILAVDLFDRVEAGTDDEYIGKVLDVVGMAWEFWKFQGVPHLNLRWTTEPPLLDTLRCTFVSPEPWAVVSLQQIVKLRGRYQQNGGQREMTECVVLAAGPDPGIVLTADNLKKGAQESSDFVALLGRRDVVVTGVVREIPNDRHVALRLNASWRADIECNADDVAELEVGQTVSIKGRSAQVSDVGKMKSLKLSNGCVVSVFRPRAPAVFDPAAARSLEFATLRKVPALVMSRAPLQNPVTVDAAAAPAEVRQKIETIRKSTAALTTTAVELAAMDYSELQKLKGQWIDVQGIATRVGKIDAPGLMELQSADGQSHRDLKVTLLNPEPFTIVAPGQRVRFRARVADDAFFAEMADGVLLEFEPGNRTIIAVTATALAQAYAADEKAAKAKYGDRTLLITGKVVGNAGGSVKLEGTDETPVAIEYFDFDEKEVGVWGPLKPGMEVRAVGKFRKSVNQIESRGCLRVSENAK